MKLAALLLVTLVPVFGGGLDAVRAELDDEKRSEKAMKAAESAFSVAKKAARDGMQAEELAALAELRAAVEIAMDSLNGSGKNPRRNPKYFKRAEITLRKLVRQLEDHSYAKSVDDRQPIEELIAYLRQSQEQVLIGIMTKKK